MPLQTQMLLACRRNVESQRARTCETHRSAALRLKWIAEEAETDHRRKAAAAARRYAYALDQYSENKAQRAASLRETVTQSRNFEMWRSAARAYAVIADERTESDG